MNQKIKTICLLLITSGILLIAVSYAWKSWQEIVVKREKLNIDLKNYELESCIKGGRYVTQVREKEYGEKGLPRVWTEWWAGRWNFEREECEKEEGKYGERGIKKE